MAYVSLYRKYRPQNFEDVVGQDHITRTLKNAIREGRIASGYLFCGTRGTAKTTCARILAKALNCIGPQGQGEAPTPEPCGVCGPCRSIAASSFVDVIEMDAASHRGIDDMRDIVSSIQFPPMEGRYKVYIIDEAHQLTPEAKDAFLKTLEEPPERVLFILATTDQQKMPITIQSRCQVFEFKRGSVAQISSRLTQVLQAEGVSADPAAVTLVARAADGSYRDSLSLLEQVLAYKRDHLAAQDVSVVLGTVDEDLLTRVVGLIADSDAAGAFALAGSILESGKDVRQFLKSLAVRFRDMLFVGVGAQAQAPGELSDSADLGTQAARFAPASLLHALETLTEAEREMRTNTQHRLLLEMALLRLMRLPASTVALIATPAVVPPVSGVVPEKAAPPLPILGQPEKEQAPLFSAPRELGAGGTLLPPPLLSEEEEGLDVPLPGDADLDLMDYEDEEPPASQIVTSAEEHDQTDDLLRVQQVAAPVPTPAANGHAAPRPTADDAAAPEELTRLQKSWQEVINRVGSNKPAAAALIKDGRAISLHGQTFTLEFSSNFNVDRISKNEAGRRMIEDQINRTLGESEGTYKIKGILRGEGSSPAKVAQGVPPRPRDPSPPVARQAVMDPLMDEVIAVFGGQIVEEDVKG